MNPYLAEFIGTTILVIFGNGVVANVVLARTKGQNSEIRHYANLLLRC